MSPRLVGALDSAQLVVHSIRKVIAVIRDCVVVVVRTRLIWCPYSHIELVPDEPLQCVIFFWCRRPTFPRCFGMIALVRAKIWIDDHCWVAEEGTTSRKLAETAIRISADLDPSMSIAPIARIRAYIEAVRIDPVDAVVQSIGI